LTPRTGNGSMTDGARAYGVRAVPYGVRGVPVGPPQLRPHTPDWIPAGEPVY